MNHICILLISIAISRVDIQVRQRLRPLPLRWRQHHLNRYYGLFARQLFSVSVAILAHFLMEAVDVGQMLEMKEAVEVMKEARGLDAVDAAGARRITGYKYYTTASAYAFVNIF